MILPRIFVGLALLSASLLTPLAAEAAPANFFGPIISEECQCETSAPDWGCVLQTVQNVVNLGISLGVIFAVLVIAYAGFLFMTSSIQAHNREKARTIMLHAVVGLMIALSAWLIVDFVMKTLYNENSGFGPWNTILSGGNACLTVTSTPTASTTTTGVTGSTGDTGSTSGRSNITDQQARSTLSSAGYTFWSSGRCTEDRQGCTHLGGVQSATLSTIASLGQACGGGMVITGGTEPGHARGAVSHGNGYKIDIDDSATANECIMNRMTRYPAGDRSGDYGGTAYRDSCGNIYVKESTHWDAAITTACTY